MGAMGFTHEHILHHYTRRLWVWRRDFGSETFWGEKIGEAYAKAGRDAMWPALTRKPLRGLRREPSPWRGHFLH